MSADRDAFIQKYKSDVIAASCGTGIFPSVTMAQLMLEGADSHGNVGQGITFLKANNGFGIKANSSWTGPKIAFSTPNDGSLVNYFRVYPTIEDSIKDHEQFLIQNHNYKDAGTFTAATPEDQAMALANAHYAEAPNYGQTLIAMINAYNLKDLDAGCSKKK